MASSDVLLVVDYGLTGRPAGVEITTGILISEINKRLIWEPMWLVAVSGQGAPRPDIDSRRAGE